MSTPNLPHTDNLTPLYELVEQLQQLVLQSVATQDQITHSVDTLAAKFAKTPKEVKEHKLKALKARHAELALNLSKSLQYVKSVTSLINNYEVLILTILEQTRNDVVSYNLGLVDQNRDMYGELFELTRQEYHEYSAVVDGYQRIMDVLARMRQLLEALDDASEDGVKTGWGIMTQREILRRREAIRSKEREKKGVNDKSWVKQAGVTSENVN